MPIYNNEENRILNSLEKTYINEIAAYQPPPQMPAPQTGQEVRTAQQPETRKAPTASPRSKRGALTTGLGSQLGSIFDKAGPGMGQHIGSSFDLGSKHGKGDFDTSNLAGKMGMEVGGKTAEAVFFAPDGTMMHPEVWADKYGGGKLPKVGSKEWNRATNNNQLNAETGSPRSKPQSRGGGGNMSSMQTAGQAISNLRQQLGPGLFDAAMSTPTDNSVPHQSQYRSGVPRSNTRMTGRYQSSGSNIRNAPSSRGYQSSGRNIRNAPSSGGYQFSNYR